MASSNASGLEPHPFSHHFFTFALVVFGVLGLFNTWGRTVLEGTFSKLLKALFGGPYVLPGTQTIMSTSFTGNYWPTDMLFDVMVVFFWEVVDGSHPRASAIGLYFISQVLGLVVGMGIDGYRGGHRGRFAFSFTFWVTMFQCTAIGFSGVFWLATHLYLSPSHQPSTSYSSILPSAHQTLVLPFSVFVGYIVPTVLIAIPLSPSYTPFMKQLGLAAWGFFPILVHLAQTILSPIATLVFSIVGYTPTVRASIRAAYAPTVLLCAFGHASFLSLGLVAGLFPSVFSPKAAAAFAPAGLFLPPLGIKAPGTVGQSVEGFMLWDQVWGYAGALAVVWGGLWSLRKRLVLEKDAVGKDQGFSAPVGFEGWLASSGATSIALMLAVAAFLLGPGTVFVSGLWLRDEIFLNKADGEAVEGKHGKRIGNGKLASR